MPKRFSYTVKKTRGKGKNKISVRAHHFSCKLKTTQCKFNEGVGRPRQCKRSTIIGSGLCWQHLLKVKKLRIKNSGAKGKGLFATSVMSKPDKRKTREDNVIFPKETILLEYVGEIIDKRELDERYPGDLTGPYAFSFENDDNKFSDAACYRGVASLINHSSLNDGNRKINVKAEEKDGKIYIKAIENINADDEILMNYGTNYRLYEKKSDVTHKTYNIKN
jgi:hypothetical protein